MMEGHGGTRQRGITLEKIFTTALLRTGGIEQLPIIDDFSDEFRAVLQQLASSSGIKPGVLLHMILGPDLFQLVQQVDALEYLRKRATDPETVRRLDRILVDLSHKLSEFSTGEAVKRLGGFLSEL